MIFKRATEVAKEKGFTLAWNQKTRLYDLTGNGIEPFAYRASWLAILAEVEFLEELEDLAKIKLAS